MSVAFYDFIDIFMCVQRKDLFFIGFYYIENQCSFFSHKLRKHMTCLELFDSMWRKILLHTPVNLKLIQFLSSVLLIFNQSWSLKLEMYKLH